MHWTILSLSNALLAVAAAVTREACGELKSRYPDSLSYLGSTTYNESISSYHSGQERELHPRCVFKPNSTTQVSDFVRLVTSEQWKTNFAIRGGGHTIWSGAANIEPGITLDMRLVSQFGLSEDKKVARIGSGALWDRIYPQLTPHNLTVLGSRVPRIGVGGFASSGGITFLSRQHGYSCDNVLGYEIVLASGEIVYVTEGSKPDLWLALKGGSNNFGVITRFDVATYHQEKMWYSVLKFNYTEKSLRAQSEAFSQWMQPANYDPAAMMEITVDYEKGALSLHNDLWYTKGQANPPVYKRFTDLPNTGATSDLATVDEVVQAFGKSLPASVERAFQLAFSFYNTEPDVYMELFRIFEHKVKGLASIDGIFTEFLIQPLPVTKGKNMFGLPRERSDEVMIAVTAVYDQAFDDSRVRTIVEDVVHQQSALLKGHGCLMDFIYLNYADGSQKVIQSWGPDNVAKLKTVSKKYDPKGVFQKQVPGGFKVSS